VPVNESKSNAPEDLGFGRVVVQASRGRFLNKDGAPTGRKYGLGAQRAARWYLAALATTWPSFFAWMFGVLLLINGCFALAYVSLGDAALVGGEGLGLADPFMRAFSFSVGLFTTNGTGTMHAVASTANWLVVFESLLGPFLLVGASGLLIARLTRPRMRLRFSESAVIAPYEGGRGLMFRIVNVHPGEVSDLQVRVSLIWFETIDGQRERNVHSLPLERNSVEFFPLHWTVVHPIAADSPLRNVTPDTLAEADAEVLVLVTAHEETFSTRVTSKMSYRYDEVRWDAKFASIFATSVDDSIAIDVERLDRMDQLAEGTTTKPAALEAADAPAPVGLML
jgi:inward rectifier potassium channel